MTENDYNTANKKTDATAFSDQASNIVVSAIILAIGGIFAYLYSNPRLNDTILFLGGLAFIIPALMSLLALFLHRGPQTSSALMRAIQAVCSVGGLGLGICILVIPEQFRSLLVYLFGALVIVGSAYRIYQLTRRDHSAAYPSWMIIAPVATLVAGILIEILPFFHDPVNEPWMVLTTGVCFLLFGLTGIALSIFAIVAAKKQKSVLPPADTISSPATPYV